MEDRGHSGRVTRRHRHRQLTTHHHHQTGVESYEVSLESQTATVVAKDDLPYEKVLATIAKTGKKVNTGEADGVAQSVEVAAAA